MHPLQPPVLLGYVLHLSNQRRIHTAKLGPPLIKTGAANPMLSTHFRDLRASLRLFQNAHNLCVAKSYCLYQKLFRYLAEKILLLNTTNFRRGITPLIQYAVEEAIAAVVDTLISMTKRNKGQLRATSATIRNRRRPFGPRASTRRPIWLRISCHLALGVFMCPSLSRWAWGTRCCAPRGLWAPSQGLSPASSIS